MLSTIDNLYEYLKQVRPETMMGAAVPGPTFLAKLIFKTSPGTRNDGCEENLILGDTTKKGHHQQWASRMQL